MNAHGDQQGGDAPAGVQGEGLLTPASGPGRQTSSRRLRRPGAAADPPAEASAAYDRYAAIYDRANAENDYETWLGELLLPELERHGLRKGWALDVGCGTGRAFEPLLSRGWQVVGCDASAGMLARAAEKFAGRVRLVRADARSLPPLPGSEGAPPGHAFDLILLLNDVLNYLTDDGDLERAFAGVERNLADSGLLVFDVNTLSLFRDDFGPDAEDSGDGWAWRGLTDEVRPEGIYEARLSGPAVETHLHRQRHWPPERIERALQATGLTALARLGQREEDGRVLLSHTPDEDRDRKIVYVVKSVAILG